MINFSGSLLVSKVEAISKVYLEIVEYFLLVDIREHDVNQIVTIDPVRDLTRIYLYVSRVLRHQS